jgi:Spy/CpxP family protein refolding chaperone
VSTSPRAAAALLVVGALLAGVVLGIAGDRAYLWHAHRIAPPHGARIGMLVEHLDHELNFTPQQKQQAAQIIERHRARMEALSASIRPQMRQELDATGAEIEKILTPEQRTKFQSMQLHRQQHRMNRRGHGPAPGLPGPPPPDVH